MKTSVSPPFQLIIQTITNEVCFPLMRSQNVCYFELIWSADAADLPTVYHSTIVFINAHSSYSTVITSEVIISFLIIYSQLLQKNPTPPTAYSLEGK